MVLRDGPSLFRTTGHPLSISWCLLDVPGTLSLWTLVHWMLTPPPGPRRRRGQSWPIRALRGLCALGLGLTASREATADTVKQGIPRPSAWELLRNLSLESIHFCQPSLSEACLSGDWVSSPVNPHKMMAELAGILHTICHTWETLKLNWMNLSLNELY